MAHPLTSLPCWPAWENGWPVMHSALTRRKLAQFTWLSRQRPPAATYPLPLAIEGRGPCRAGHFWAGALPARLGFLRAANLKPVYFILEYFRPQVKGASERSGPDA